MGTAALLNIGKLARATPAGAFCLRPLNDAGPLPSTTGARAQNGVPGGLSVGAVAPLTAVTGLTEPGSKRLAAELCSPASVVAVFAGVAGCDGVALRVAPAATSVPVATAAASF